MSASFIPRSTADGISAEQEQDANSALTELDKGLRSGKIGIQCEAIVKFPRLFEKYPFPILINSALLKIADVYRGGNNFIRLNILRVVQQSEKHLDKILNVDEFLRRIFGVIHSNDPIARAITLRMMGSIASIVPEKTLIHHSIILALDSHDAVEVEASIFAADKFSEKSKTFARTICSKMVAMLSGLATPVDLKVKLIPSLRHMHHDSDTAAQAFAVCESLLEGYPAKKFVLLTLDTMTRLAVQSLVNVAPHVARLLQLLMSDPRHDIHLCCLRNLCLLARRGPHLWQTSDVEQDQCACYKCCFDQNISLAARSIQVLTHIAKASRMPGDIPSEVVSAVQTFFFLGSHRCGEESAGSEGKPAQLVCEALTAVGNKFPDSLQGSASSYLALLQKWTIEGLPSDHVQVQLCTLVFQAAREQLMPPDVQATLRLAVEKCESWQAYRIARQALRYGQFSFAELIFSDLAYKVSSESYYNWLLGLKNVCTARRHLHNMQLNGFSAVPCLSSCLESYQRALVAFKAASTPAHPLEFQCEYVRLSIVWLSSLRLLLLTCNTFRSSPPPAIVTALASTSGQEGARWVQVVQQLEKCEKHCRDVAQQISTLYWASFDADPSTLGNLTLLQQSCNCIKSAIASIISVVHTGQSSLGEHQFLAHPEVYDENIWGKSLPSTIVSILKELKTMLAESAGSPEKLYRLIDFLSMSAQNLVQANISFPRFFFQQLQSTNVKLAISPQPSNAGEPVLVRSDTNLTLKVEGVIQKGERPSIFRSVAGVNITVTTSLVNRTVVPQADSLEKSTEKTSVQLSQTVGPHNEYFSTSFVLPFPVLGLHSVQLDAAIVDETGACWHTGPRTTLNIKSYDDSIQRQQPPRSGSRVVAAVVAAAAAAAANSH
ncbi:integrator complex subunit 7-like [Pomacea canaliculata]|uniref:integrator complex subunit 7-like n=1 Tax=Pomacea canaliculata TaxID=400727 RepID=UPI000D734D31|nr:integrator complex subunit 7-like [Pomacea canaliculata]